MIKNVVFDMGNVLVRYQPADFIKGYTSHPEEQRLLVNEIFGSVEWLQFDRGAISKDEMAVKICQRLPIEHHGTVSEILTHWYEGLQPIEEISEIVRQLKEQGYRLYILSNASQDYYHFRSIIPTLELFDGEFVSSDWQLLKPEKAIYQSFYSHFQLVPSECYFIDDIPMNVECSRRTGMASDIFRGDCQELLVNLRENRIDI